MMKYLSTADMGNDEVTTLKKKKKFLDTYKSSIFTKMLHIRQIKSSVCEAAECPFPFATKLEGIG